MKSIRKILSVLTALAIIAVMFTAAAIPVYADPGDVWYLNHNQTNWAYYDQNITYDTGTKTFTVAAGANSSDSFTANDFLLTNGSDNPLKPNTPYRIMFDVSAVNKTIDLYTAKIGHYFYKTGEGGQFGFNITTIDNLTAYAEQYESDDYNRYHVSIVYTTPETLAGTAYGKNSFFDIAVSFTANQGTPIFISNVHTEELALSGYNVIDSTTGGSIGTVYGVEGDNVYELLKEEGLIKSEFVTVAEPEVIASDTTSITVTYIAKREISVYDAETEKLLGTVFAIDGDDAYTLIGNSAYNIDGFNFEVEPEFVEDDTEALYVTYSESPVQMIYFDKNYRGNSASTSFASWQQLATDGNGTLEIVNDKLSPRVWETGGIKMTDKTQFSNRAFVLANNYGKSGIVPGKTYRVIMRITLDTQYWTINQLNAEIKFGANVWNDLTDYATLSGEELAALVVDTEERDTVVDYILSMNIAVPEGVKNNIVMSLYGFNTTVNAETGEETTSGVFYTVDSVEIWNTYDVAVEDQNGEALGVVKARIGDSVERVAKTYLGIHGDYKYTATAQTVEALDKPIVLEKAMRDCLVSFVANGGTGEMADEEVQIGEYTLPECRFTAPQGKAFKAWSVAEVEKQPGETITINDDTEVTAVWKCLHENTEAEGAVDATCTDTGLTGVVTCVDCGTVIIPESLEVPALGHDYNAVVTEPTCTEQGYTTHTCSRCGDSYVDSYVNALGHIGDTEIKDAKAATCTEAGYTGDTYCLGCDAKIADGEVIKALGHTGGTATCCKKAVCTRCKKEYGGLDAKNHTGGTEVKGKKAATEEAQGYTGDTYCKGCGAKLSTGKSIPALVVTYKITYKLDGGTNVKNPATYTYATSTITLKNPTKKGYTFKGWYNGSKKVTEIKKGSKGNITLTAKWAVITYKITYKLNSGKNNAKNPASYKITSSDITLKAPTRKGYKFGGWYSDSKLTKKVTKIAKGSTGNKTLYAKWTAIEYKITYKLNSGKNNAKNPKSYKVTTSTITLKAATRKGYTFKGWYNGSKKVTKIAKGSTGNMTLTAKWAKKK